MPHRRLIVMIYLVLAFCAAAACYVIIGKDLLPKTNNGQLQLRVREPDGTRLEVTERATQAILNIIDSTVHSHIAISSAYVGLVPSNFGTSNLYIFNSGTHESVIQINLDDDYKVKVEDLKEELRKNILQHYPGYKDLLRTHRAHGEDHGAGRLHPHRSPCSRKEHGRYPGLCPKAGKHPEGRSLP